MADFPGISCLNVKVLFSNHEKAHPCAEPRRLTILRENRFGGLGCGALEDSTPKSRVNIFDAQFRAYGEKKLLEGSILNVVSG